MKLLNILEMTAVKSQSLPGSNVQTSQATNPRLTNKQVEMIRALSEGATMKDISAQTGISFHTVHAHLREAYKRLNARGSNNAVAIAIRAGLI